MTSPGPRPVVVHGASGHAGRLICEYLHEYHVPFIAAGRDGGQVRAVVEQIPGIETAEYDVVEVDHDVAALADVFRGAQVVCSTVGPFTEHGPVTVEAALAAGCHYLDTTAEQSWALLAQHEFGKQFAEAGLLLAPGIAQMCTTGEIAANIALEAGPGLDTLDMLVLWKGFPTRAPAQMLATILRADWFHLVDDEYVAWDHRATRECVVPGQHATALTVPWGGTLNPVWFKDDPRVANCLVTGGVTDRAVMDGVVATTGVFEESIRLLDPEEQEVALSGVLADLRAGPASRANPHADTTIDSVHASGPLGRVHVALHGTSTYEQTGRLQAFAVHSLLQQAPRRVGFASACQAFGHRELLGVLRSSGLVMNPIVSAYS